jgi:hypothetical protein
MTVAAWLRRYAAHPDPATATANLVALVVASNGPFYPLYVLALVPLHSDYDRLSPRWFQRGQESAIKQDGDTSRHPGAP